jgi:hypothetical protein
MNPSHLPCSTEARGFQLVCRLLKARTFLGKTLLITVCFITAACAIAQAQQSTRDKLFPSFKEDVTRLEKKETVKDPRATAASARSLIFTRYEQQPAGAAAKSRLRTAQPLRPAAALPSDTPAAADTARKTAPAGKAAQPPIPHQ